MTLKSLVKGKFGEFVFGITSFIYLGREYKRLNDITLRLDDGSTTQIDQILVSPYGIFVIEIKNYSGLIYGSPDAKTWTQIAGHKKYAFQNPLLQNFRHLKALEEILDVELDKLHSVIIFSAVATIKGSIPSNVCSGGKYIDHVKEFSRIIFSDDEVMRLRDRLKEVKLKGFLSAGIEHRKNLKDRLERKQLDNTRSNVKEFSQITPSLSPGSEALLLILKAKRNEMAKRDGIPPHHVFANKTLEEMASSKPTDKESMLKVSGVGPMKFDRYGSEFISAILNFTQEKTA